MCNDGPQHAAPAFQFYARKWLYNIRYLIRTGAFVPPAKSPGGICCGRVRTPRGSRGRWIRFCQRGLMALM